MRVLRKVGLGFIVGWGLASGGLASPALAQAGGWDGTWAGVIGDGGSVAITISGAQATQYLFRGEDVPVNGSGPSGRTFLLDVGSGHSAIRLTKAEKMGVSYSYRGSDGSTAAATLTRQ